MADRMIFLMQLCAKRLNLIQLIASNGHQSWLNRLILFERSLRPIATLNASQVH